MPIPEEWNLSGKAAIITADKRGWTPSLASALAEAGAVKCPCQVSINAQMPVVVGDFPDRSGAMLSHNARIVEQHVHFA